VLFRSAVICQLLHENSPSHDDSYDYFKDSLLTQRYRTD
jgi:hypothetical protein